MHKTTFDMWFYATAANLHCVAEALARAERKECTARRVAVKARMRLDEALLRFEEARVLLAKLTAPRILDEETYVLSTIRKSLEQLLVLGTIRHFTRQAQRDRQDLSTYDREVAYKRSMMTQYRYLQIVSAAYDGKWHAGARLPCGIVAFNEVWGNAETED